MKNKITLVLGGLLLLSQAAMAVTVSSTLTVSASIPAATGLQLTVTPYDATTQVAGTPSTTATTIPFGTLAYSSSLGRYTSANYYSVVAAPIGGSANPNISVSYVEGTNPNGTSNGLGTKVVATFLNVNSTTNAETVSSLGKKMLTDLTTSTAMGVPPAGSYPKVYLGLWTGAAATATSPADPATGKTFTNTDASGAYNGTLTFTATI